MNEELLKLRHTENELEKVLEGYAIETPAGNDRKILKRWMRKYPQFAEDLMEFAARRAVIRNAPAPEIPSEKAARYRNSGMESLGKFLSAREESSANLTSLTKLAKRFGMNKKNLADSLGLSISLVMYLEKRRLRFATIPNQMIERIAGVLKTSERAVAEYLQQGPAPADGLNFKSDTRPKVDLSEGEESKDFAEAVREDQTLPPKAKENLLQMQ